MNRLAIAILAALVCGVALALACPGALA